MRRGTAPMLSLAATLALGMGVPATAQATRQPQPSGPSQSRTLSGELGLGFTSRGALLCRSSQGTGETTSPTTGTMKITMQGCEIPFAKVKCGNVAPGEIQTNQLVTELGTVNAAKGQAGEDFKPASGEVLTEFNCESLTVKVKGSVIGNVVATNSMTEEQTLVFAVEYVEHQGFKQVPESFEGMPVDVLKAMFEGQGEEAAFLTSAVQIKNQPAAVTVGGTTIYVKDPTEVRVGPSGKPEFGRCQKARHAMYANGNCTVSSSNARHRRGRFEWHPI